jgi:MtN3 and saliva related transmembrane protein
MDWITAIGLLAAAFTTFSFLPQAIKTIRMKEARDISIIMYIVMLIGVILWLTYGILLSNLPIIAANSISMALSLLILGLKIKYK